MKKIKIENKLVGDKEPCFIIAEVGVNHNGDLSLAKKMIDEAKKAGADAIKFQSFKAETLVTKSAEKEKYQRTKTKESQYEMLKKLELSEKEQKALFSYCQKRKIIFLSTPYGEEDADFLEKLGVPAFKISSSDITHLPLLKHIAKKKLPMIISTGASYLEEVKEAVKAVKSQGNNKIILMHCTNIYPAPLEDVNLRAIYTLRKTFNLPIGYSDHTLGTTVPIAAVAIGAVAIEKHFTLDRKLPGPDQKASSEPKEIKEMVKLIRDTEKALGAPLKAPVRGEHEDRILGRRSIIAKTDIKKGEIIKNNMLIIKRPGDGIQPKDIDKIIGKRAKRNIKKDVSIKRIDI